MPSRVIRPSEATTIATPGAELVRGSGTRIEAQNRQKKVPTTRSPVGPDMNNRRGRASASIQPNQRFPHRAMRVSPALPSRRWANFSGNHGSLKPATICPASTSIGTAMTCGMPYRKGMHTGKASAKSTTPKARSLSFSMNSASVMPSSGACSAISCRRAIRPVALSVSRLGEDVSLMAAKLVEAYCVVERAWMLIWPRTAGKFRALHGEAPPWRNW